MWSGTEQEHCCYDQQLGENSDCEVLVHIFTAGDYTYRYWRQACWLELYG